MGFEHYDVFVIGSGSAGRQVATRCAKEGMKVAIADNREYGGTCANRGCDPKKVLLNASEIIARTSDMTAVGVTEIPKIDWQALQKFKEKFVSAMPVKTEESLDKLGITMYHQSPQFIEEGLLSVEGKKVTVDKVVIASGLIPRPLHFEGAELFKTSDDFLELPALPESIIFVGGGYIAMEFAHIAARCGVDVTIIERGERVLKMFDASITGLLEEESKKIGINFIFNADVIRAEMLQKNTRVFYTRDGKEQSVKAEMVFNTSGRVPSVDMLALDKGNVATTPRGIKVNEYLQSTTNSNVYACGDVADSGSLPLTPLSSKEGRHVGVQLATGTHTKYDFPAIPTAVYTTPQLAMVGLTEDQAKEQGISYKVLSEHVPDWFSVKRLNSKNYCYKTLKGENDEILGAEILAPEASEMINLFAMAIQQKLTCTQFRETIFAYPTFASDMQSMV
ncbi:dihydrolipoyl dehydrogenase family protein [Dokdonia donghaensis]|uniref:Pyridine nucleotide-disulfide oxidoreductase n=1 Tax=Dokdonia donghaensis DSW-1 TaxID=1300343 RepID=A0A0A2GWC3_9FLAO|nr:NAD(P)/FAD-dependent oxidoreductase [Dokdonia donghaensis]ANH59430.1 Glutathione amide reductase [Dokdonia donghaensis DSW-1]KGO06818.1 pyridine nucleotide-disulfide oxidoreductase [Dokdonia donghaensis DSW-1]